MYSTPSGLSSLPLQPFLPIPNQAGRILALWPLHFLYVIQPEILSFCVITVSFTHAAQMNTFLLFLLANSRVEAHKLDGESRLPAVTTHAREGWVPWDSPADWTHVTR